jgi:hypothetical protein
MNEIISNSESSRGALNAAKTRAGRALSSPSALASGQLVRVVGRLNELGLRMGYSQCKPDRISRRT